VSERLDSVLELLLSELAAAPHPPTPAARVPPSPRARGEG
jgi:hypothetical protein